MDRDQRAAREVELRRRFDAGDLGGVATLAIEGYGPEIYGLLLAVARDEDSAAEAFAETSADLWRDLPGFRWECSLRTWLYTVARHRLIEHERDPARRPRRNLPLSQTPEVGAMAQRVRTVTASYRRTEVKEGVGRLRERLDPDDRTLLILRVDRGLSWRDVTRVMGGVSETALRKRYERVKERLREMAKAEGLV